MPSLKKHQAMNDIVGINTKQYTVVVRELHIAS